MSDIPEGLRLYKVVGATGAAIHGGEMAWSLPSGDQPGEWHTVNGTIRCCARGLHLTPKPIAFWQPNSRVFEVEWRGDTDSQLADDASPKVAVSECRLTREVEWTEFCVWLEGEHSVGDGRAIAYGSATVEAYGSATVEAHDSATVRAYGSATVRAYGSATVRASGSATVRAHDSATVEAYDSATVEAYDSANVISTIFHSPTAQVALAGLAAHIDRRNSKVELRKAAEA